MFPHRPRRNMSHPDVAAHPRVGDRGGAGISPDCSQLIECLHAAAAEAAVPGGGRGLLAGSLVEGKEADAPRWG